jgi:hypothetical protein
MTLERIYYLSQSIASIAVVCSLIYLALQARHAERSQRGVMQQGRADRTSQTTLTLASPELAPVWQKGLSADPDLSRFEFTQWMLLCRSSFLSGEDSFLQHKAGLLAKPAFESFVAGTRFYMSNPGMRVAWQLSSGHFGREFRGFVDSILRDTAIAPIADAYAEWKRLVQSNPSIPAA